MLDFILHLDKHLDAIIIEHGSKVYAIVAAIIFAETAVVIFPFLPGDSLLFALGVVAVRDNSPLNWGLLYLILTAAAIVGNVVNYHIGRMFGAKLFQNPKSKIFTQANLAKTHQFFEKHGNKTIVITRFVPILRAFAPFVAGMGAMTFGRFMLYNVLGGALWVGVCMGAGSLLGNIPIIKERFELAILALVILSVLPVVFEVIVHRRKAKRAVEAVAEEIVANADGAR